MDGWRPYLSGMARGVRRYALAHPHAFPLVATRPPGAPWVNPPLRSLRWVEAMLRGLAGEGFSDEQVLFTYRAFNGFLLGHLLLETSAMTLRDPKPGDGSFSGTDTASGDGGEPAGGAPADPVLGGLSPARSAEQREAVEDAGSLRELIDPAGEIDARRFPTVHRLAAGLAQDRWATEFETGLEAMLDRIAMFVAGVGPQARLIPRPQPLPADARCLIPGAARGERSMTTYTELAGSDPSSRFTVSPSLKN